jgi:hypothetical protein
MWSGVVAAVPLQTNNPASALLSGLIHADIVKSLAIDRLVQSAPSRSKYSVSPASKSAALPILPEASKATVPDVSVNV